MTLSGKVGLGEPGLGSTLGVRPRREYQVGYQPAYRAGYQPCIETDLIRLITKLRQLVEYICMYMKPEYMSQK